MPELRKDPVTGRWVIISTDRQKRPNDFVVERARIIGREHCPFCSGRESLTPPEIMSYRQNGGAPGGGEAEEAGGGRDDTAGAGTGVRQLRLPPDPTRRCGTRSTGGGLPPPLGPGAAALLRHAHLLDRRPS